MRMIDTTVQPPADEDLFDRRHPLDSLFTPKVVAVIGSTERPDSVGRSLMENLQIFGGTTIPIHPHRDQVLGKTAYPDVLSAPGPIDLAVIATPAKGVPQVIGQCVEAGVKAAIIISAGFKECGVDGATLEQQIMAEARRGPLRVIGPNCLGLMNPWTRLNATFAQDTAVPGSVGFISQSGALCTAVLDWSLREKIGFSAFVSVGSMLDVGWGDLISYLGDDPHTQSIVLYMESVGDARSFLSAAREVALSKPIVVLKAGRTEIGARAATSHTGALTGSDEVLDAAFRRCGVLRVQSIADLFNMAGVLAKQPRPAGPRLTVITNAGGPGVLAADALVTDGGRLAEISEETVASLNNVLPAAWSHGNPIDILGDAEPERYARALEIASEDPNTDGLLVILTPQAMIDPTRTAELLRPYAQRDGKPILASWMGGAHVEAGETILNEAGIPAFPYPDTAARLFHYMSRHNDALRSLYETPTLPIDSEVGTSGCARAAEILQAARASGRTLLTEVEAKQVLTAYHIPTVETRVAVNESDAVRMAEEIGYPIVLKLHSETITHKTDVGGVKLNLTTADAVRNAYREIEASVRSKAAEGDFLGVTVQPMISTDGYELILGSSLDSQFGPIVLFGMGGQLVEVFKDRALALPPLNTTLARRAMEQTRIYTALQGVRGRKSIDMDALEQLLVRFSFLVVEQRWIREIDINPLLVSPEGLIALDARIVLHGPDAREETLPRPAIRPYPTRYVGPWKTKNGIEVVIRPIRPEDEPLMVRFHAMLSDRSAYARYFHMIKRSQRVSHERLAQVCFVDYDRQMALVAERKDSESGECEILAVGRLIKSHGRNEAEIAVTVADPYQGQGLGSALTQRLLKVAREERLDRVTAQMLDDNLNMQRIFEKLGFHLHLMAEDKLVQAELDL